MNSMTKFFQTKKSKVTFSQYLSFCSC